MELVQDAQGRGQFSYAQVARLLLRHTYLPKAQVDIAGSSHFGGKEDWLMLCAGKAGASGIAIAQLCSDLNHLMGL
ncbi:hypothetical protein BDR04DRAFT_1109220 [Suillus decipiens]|nr:hypothetical protein BDR04DRAFT_1109220 [Suillus decipiens]